MSTGANLRDGDQQTATSASTISRIWPPWSALRLFGLLLCVAAAVLAVVLLGGKDAESAATGHAEPAVLEDVDGESLRRVVLTSQAAARLAIETAPVRISAGGTVVPYAAVIYDAHGATWVYANPERLEFVRASVEVKRIAGETAYLADGPPIGTEVVTVGGAELYGAEFDVGH